MARLKKGSKRLDDPLRLLTAPADELAALVDEYADDERVIEQRDWWEREGIEWRG